MDYLVTMKLPPAPRSFGPTEGLAFVHDLVLPTLEACETLSAQGRILAGGPTLGVMGFTFIARASAPQDLEEMVATLPLWSRADTTIVPLGKFGDRLAVIRQRLATSAANVAHATSRAVQTDNTASGREAP